MRRRIIIALIMAFLSVGSTCLPQQTSAAPMPNVSVLITTKIVAGCTLTVSVDDEPGLSGPYKVSQKGTIHFTMADDRGANKVEWDVAVAGKTVDEAAKTITESLKAYLLRPAVHVVISEMPRLRVEVSGPVRHPGPISLPLDSHLADALGAAQCLPDTDLSKILILRKEATSDKITTYRFDENAALAGQGDDFKLQSGDRVILVAQSKPPPQPVLMTVRVVGEVKQEGDVPIGKGATVKDVLARVGGLKETADTRQIRLHRASTGKDYVLDADKIEANDPLYNIPVIAGDYIVVDKRDRSQRWSIDGEVKAPNTFDYDPAAHMTILRAVERAGGPTKKADLHHGVLRRGYLFNPAQTRDLPFDYEQIKNGKAADWDLESGDMVVLLPRRPRPSVLQSLVPLLLHFLPFGL